MIVQTTVNSIHAKRKLLAFKFPYDTTAFEGVPGKKALSDFW